MVEIVPETTRLALFARLFISKITYIYLRLRQLKRVMIMTLRHFIHFILLFLPISLCAHPNIQPLEFVKNDGQWDGPFLYKIAAGNVNVFLENNRITYHIGAIDNASKLHDYHHGKLEKEPTLYYHTYRVNILGMNPEPEVIGTKPQQHYYNYYLGNNPDKWKAGIHPNLAVDYKQVYKNIDLHFASENTRLKYDFIVYPGGDADNIQLQYEGADDVTLHKGKLVITTSVGNVEELAPYAYQYIDGMRHEVTCKYKLKDGIVTYHFPKGYNHNANLIIDPTVVFSTYTGSTSDNWGFAATYDDDGAFYAGGATNGGGYPSTTGATFQGGGSGGGNTTFQCDYAITKFNAAGTARVYSTYVGGSDNDQPQSMVVMDSTVGGNTVYKLAIVGRTYSNNFPNVGVVYDNSYNGGADLAVTILEPNGQLARSTFIGGSGDDGVNITSLYNTVNSLKHSYGDEARSEIIVDAQQNLYVASCTKSNNFPLANASQSSLSGTQDAVIFKLDKSLSNLLWSTYLGGTGNDAAYVLSLNNSGSHLFVSGGTASNNFPFTGGTLWGSYQGGAADGFIAKFQNSGSYPRQIATAIGRAGYDQCFGIQVDNENSVYAMGQTLGGTFPVSAGVFNNAGSSQFVIKLDSNLSTNVFSTVFGSGTSTTVNISPVAFLVDTCQNIYISGWGGNTSLSGGNNANMPTNLGTPAPALLRATNPNGNGFYFIVLSKDAVALLFGGYFGDPSGIAHVDGGTSRFSENGVIYQAICGGCSNGTTPTNDPTTTGVVAPTRLGNNCNLLALKIAFNLGAVEAIAAANPSTNICIGETVQFSNNSANATSYEWDFGDGSPISTQTAPTHVYNNAGSFTVRLIARNPNACFTVDTTTLTIVVDTNSIDADFDVMVTDSCDPFIATFTNTSKYGNVPGNATLTWNFGDGSNFTGNTPPAHSYSQKGTYTITLTMSDPSSCNKVDSISKTISFNNILVKADMEAPNLICENTMVNFLDKSENATAYTWNFGDGNTSTDPNPYHLYDSTGKYTIVFYASNPNSCNKTDTLTREITVSPVPQANFVHAPVIPETNEPVNFTNRSIGADKYYWNFGDGTGSEKETPDPHYYKKTGNYTVCLVAATLEGCLDTLCKKVDADVFPLADVPTAFSPNGDGNNDILRVRGSGIETINLRIFNRWGELVFETNDEHTGWDGNYNNKEQPVDAYAYVLNVSFVDGSTLYKKGNVTLIR